MSEAFTHRPVLLDDVVELFRPVPAGVVVDATIGGGGHAVGLLEAHPHIEIIGIDRDDDALAAAATTLSGHAGRFVLRKARFDQIATVLRELGHDTAVGVLFDLGVSSPQLDRPERGFSYRDDGPLDMRMDRSQSLTAADVVNGYDEARLARVLRDHADERFAGRIARALVRARPLRRTSEVVDVIRASIPAPARRRGGHPAKRTFQALRIEVNDELAILPAAIDDAIDVLAPRGRCVVLSYHSGEDRIVKDRFNAAATGGCTCPPGLPCACGARPIVRPVRRRTRRPAPAEIAANRRAESARLRVVEKLGDDDVQDDRR